MRKPVRLGNLRRVPWGFVAATLCLLAGCTSSRPASQRVFLPEGPWQSGPARDPRRAPSPPRGAFEYYRCPSCGRTWRVWETREQVLKKGPRRGPREAAWSYVTPDDEPRKADVARCPACFQTRIHRGRLPL